MHFGDLPPSEDVMALYSGAVVSAGAISVGGNYRFLFGDDKAWIFQARLGLMRAKFDENYSFPGVPTTTYSSSSYDSGAYLGLGIGRRVTQNFSLILAFDLYNLGEDFNRSQKDVTLEFLGLEAEYRF